MRKWIFLLNNNATSAVNDSLSFVKNKQTKKEQNNKKAKTEPPWPALFLLIYLAKFYALWNQFGKHS